MKKIALGIGIAVLLIFSIVFFLSDKEEKQTIELGSLQEKVTQQLAQMQNSGFSIVDRKMQKEKEHFFISIVDPKKASAYLTQRGLRITPKEAQELKECKFSVDLSYLSDTYSLDIYPVEWPPYLKSTILQKEDANILAQLEALIEKKVFFMHVDMDHSGSDFKGYIKDIDETLQGEQKLHMQLLGLHFSGNIKEEKVVGFKQAFKNAHLSIANESSATISGLQSNYELTGPTAYDYISQYSIGKVKSTEGPDNTLLAENISLLSTSKVENGLAKETLKADIKNVNILYEKEKIAFQTLLLDMNISNIDIAVLDKLQTIDTKDDKKLDPLLETLVEKSMHLDISNLSADKVVLRGKEVGGFHLDADLDIDQSLDIYRLNIQPKHALDKMYGDIHLSVSKEILAMLKEDHEFMLIYMMYRPKRKLGQRIYNIKLGDGKIKINGKTVDF